MRFAVSGSHSVGKSTVLKSIEEQKLFPNNIMVKEVVRTLAAQGVKINKGADHKSQMIILEEHYKNVLRYENMISDRCSLDAFAYATWDYLHGAYTYQEHKEHEAIFLDVIKYYDEIFYIAPEFPIVDDGFRSTDAIYQNEIHVIFEKIIKQYNLNVIHISGSVEKRVSRIAAVILSKVIKKSKNDLKGHA